MTMTKHILLAPLLLTSAAAGELHCEVRVPEESLTHVMKRSPGSPATFEMSSGRGIHGVRFSAVIADDGWATLTAELPSGEAVNSGGAMRASAPGNPERVELVVRVPRPPQAGMIVRLVCAR
jgi:hypothetical protein